MAIKTDPIELNDVRIADISSIRVGDSATFEQRIASGEIAAFADLSGDVNPLHLDARVARAQGFTGPVAHGMLALGMISRLIGTELPGAGSLWVSQDVQFPAAVLEGDSVVATVTVIQVSVATGLVVLRTDVTNLTSGAVVLKGRASVRVPNRRTVQALAAR